MKRTPDTFSEANLTDFQWVDLDLDQGKIGGELMGIRWGRGWGNLQDICQKWPKEFSNFGAWGDAFGRGVYQKKLCSVDVFQSLETLSDVPGAKKP